MSTCLRYIILQALAVIAVFHSAYASSVVFVPAQQQKGTKISPPLPVLLEARAVWYKCGLRSFDDIHYRIDTRPPTQDFTVFILRKEDVHSIAYKTDGQKLYPSTARGKCNRQVLCDKSADAIYFNYYERCIVVGSDSTTAPLNFLVSLQSKLNVKVILLWTGVGLVALLVLLSVLGCLWGCLKGCLRPKKSYRYI